MKKTALISVTDKIGILIISNELIKNGYSIIATSGTSKLLNENKIACMEISDFTGFPEILEGRVKTLHPKVFAGILADPKKECHNHQLEKLRTPFIDIVICNLYDFENKKNIVSESEIINYIDIGGASLMRAAAKNYVNTIVLTSPEQYAEFILKLNNNDLNEDYRKKLATAAFRKTGNYDMSISNYFSGIDFDEKIFSVNTSEKLAYGENPHQSASHITSIADKYILKPSAGSRLSYNNILDAGFALKLVENFRSENFCAIIKHNNPCGAAYGLTQADAYLRAFECDPVSAYGGIIVFNKTVTEKTANLITKNFTEMVIASDFENGALEVLKKKEKMRIVSYSANNNYVEVELRYTNCGMLVQSCDKINEDISKLRSKTSTAVDLNKYDDIWLALNLCRALKSNAIAITNNGRLAGAGCGQPNRVDSVRIALNNSKKFGLNTDRGILASDGFFPFADSIELIRDSGIKTIIQPGGSKRDEEVITACEKYKIALIITGIRHFLH